MIKKVDGEILEHETLEHETLEHETLEHHSKKPSVETGFSLEPSTHMQL